MLKKLCGLAVVVAQLGAAPALAQVPGSFELEPYVGVYVPTQALVSDAVLGVKLSQKEGLVVGGRIGYWITVIGIEGNFRYAFSDAEADDSGTVTQESAAVWSADARLIWQLLPGPIGIHINGGVAVIGFSGDAYADLDDGKTNIGGVVGAGVRIKLPGIFAIRGDVDGYMYQAELGTAEKQFQADVIASAGLIFALGL